MAEATALIEPVPIQDLFCSGIARIEKVPGGCFRFVLYVDQARDDGAMDRVIVGRIVGPIDAVPGVIQQMTRALADSAAQVIGFRQR